MSYESAYLFNAPEIELLSGRSANMEEALKAAYDEAKSFLVFMQSTDLWVGQLKEEFTAYLHLVVQYHGWLLGETVPSVGTVASITPELNCCGEMNKAWKNLIKAMGSFKDDSTHYKDLEAL